MAGKCPRNLPGLRDRALLLLVAATLSAKLPRSVAKAQPDDKENRGGVPRLFLLALDAEHVRFTASGVALGVRTRTDDAAPSRTVTLTRDVTGADFGARIAADWLR